MALRFGGLRDAQGAGGPYLATNRDAATGITPPWLVTFLQLFW